MRRVAVAGLAMLMMSQAAQAHPHVWITAKAELVFDESGRIAAVRHAWTFDEAFSTFAVQGVSGRKDGPFSREELQPLAETHVASLPKFGFFTSLQAEGAQASFELPKDYWLEFKDGALTLHLLLVLKTPLDARSGGVTFDVDDPTFFIAFDLAGPAPVALSEAPQNCRVEPKPIANEVQGLKSALSEYFFGAPAARGNAGPRFANGAIVSCR